MVSSFREHVDVSGFRKHVDVSGFRKHVDVVGLSSFREHVDIVSSFRKNSRCNISFHYTLTLRFWFGSPAATHFRHFQTGL